MLDIHRLSHNKRDARQFQDPQKSPRPISAASGFFFKGRACADRDFKIRAGAKREQEADNHIDSG
jgi:hypothetical protein